MKNLIFILLLFTSFVSLGQSPGNNLNKYIHSPNQYGIWHNRVKADSVTDIPQDTTHSKDGIARKGNRFFVGNGVFWREIFPSSSSVTYGVDSITYSNNLLCQWKDGLPTCYTIIGGGGVDSVTLVGDQLCQFKSGVSTCYTITDGILGTFLDSVVVTGNQLCQWKTGVSTCYTINNVNNGIDSVTVVNGQLCSWKGGVSTCYTLPFAAPGVDSVVIRGGIMCVWIEGSANCFDLDLYHARATLNFDSTRILFYNLKGQLLGDSINLPVLKVRGTYPQIITQSGDTATWSLAQSFIDSVTGPQNLQQVTNVGNVTTRSIYVDSLVGTSDAIIHGLTVGRGLAAAGIDNTVIGGGGAGSQFNNTSGAFGRRNTAIGYGALDSVTTGFQNVGIGYLAASGLKTGLGVVAIGPNAYRTGTTNNNVAIGSGAMELAAGNGQNNVAIGTNSLRVNTTGNSINAIGVNSLIANTSGADLVAMGNSSLLSNTTGSFNTAIGSAALQTLTTGRYNTGIGYAAKASTITGTNAIAIGANAIAEPYQLALSDSTTGMKFKNLDSAAGTAPSVIGKSGDGLWHVYATPSAGGGGGSVTNVATGLGLSGGPITTTGTLLVDTASASILSRQRAAATYAPKGAIVTNVKDYGALGDGSTNDQAAIATALAATPVKGILFFPDGEYLVSSTVTVNKLITVMGTGQSRIKVTGNITALTLGANGVTVQNLNFHGSGKAGANTSQMGINCNGFYDFSILSCQFDSLNGRGLYWLNTSVGTRYGGRVTDCFFNLNNIGFESGVYGEYVTVTGGAAKGNTIASKIGGGNVMLSGVNIHDNDTGVQIVGGSNNGHGSATGCTINHNSTYNVQVSDDSLGFEFVGCQIFDSYIHIKNSIAISFVGCEIAPVAMYFENATGTKFSSNTFYTGYGFAVNNNYNSTTSETFYNNNQYLGGTTSGVFIGQDTTKAAGSLLEIMQSKNATITQTILNPNNSGASAGAALLLGSQNGAKSGSLAYHNDAYSLGTGFELLTANSLSFGSSSGAVGGLLFSTAHASAPIVFATGGVATANERMRITPAGLIGIGKTVPVADIDVEKTVAGDVAISATNLGNSTTARGRVNAVSGTTAMGMYANSPLYTGIGNWGGRGIFYGGGVATALSIIHANASGKIEFAVGGSDPVVNQKMEILANGNVLIGTTTDNSKLTVNGSFAAGYVAKTATYTATISDFTINCTSGTFTVTLPTAVGCAGRMYVVTNSGAGTITVGTTSSQTFTNVTATPTTLTITGLGAVIVQSTGAAWLQLK